ncbi:hypothetical protein [Conservatibacter flavescens]|uniref:Lipoprotein n=1 Tax=Conservatibacter flavescens TaxID=28161 RepID=A0A2M8S452_9PAST|nr:hypothetical protein [Conservatibacter flavescens]PJG85922.1 hypothetical protein CVP05_03390 [Conservatibacter flavescens]
MKKRIFVSVLMPLALAACSNTVQQPTAPLDMRSVEAYNQKVYSGDTVPAQQKKSPVEVDTPLNASDNAPKGVVVQPYARPRVIIAPTVGYGYHRHRYHW